MSQLSPSRPQSRSSMRAPSPSVQQDDPVLLRQQMSQLKHEIRQKSAHYSQLENQLLRHGRPGNASSSPRPPSPELSPSMSPPPSSYNQTTSPLMKRRSSDVLAAIAGEGSYLPLPNGRGSISSRQDGLQRDSIQEGVPIEFETSGSSLARPGSPARTISRIPVSSVGLGRALAEDGRTGPPAPVDVNAANASSTLGASTTSGAEPPSPNTRRSLGGNMGGTTKVLAELQAGVQRTQTALENTKQQLRLSQRQVAQLTRQTEDLKDGRDRLRLENETLNNVVTRKERLLQELLERARKAEAEAAQYKAQLKTESAGSKKAIRDMEIALSESTALSQKSEREYLTLKDSVKGLSEGWARDVQNLRDEMVKKQEESRKEAEEIAQKYKSLVKLVQQQQAERARLETLKVEVKASDDAFEAYLKGEIANIKAELATSTSGIDKAGKTAEHLAGELQHMRRLMRIGGRPIDVEPTPAS